MQARHATSHSEHTSQKSKSSVLPSVPFSCQNHLTTPSANSSSNIPRSLKAALDEKVIDQAKESNIRDTESTCVRTLKPGHFVMQTTCWPPRPSEVPAEESPEDSYHDGRALWRLYFWSHRGAGAVWNLDPSCTTVTTGSSSGPASHHPRLGEALNRIKTHGDGSLSHVALGECSDSFFIRLSDNSGHWHFRRGGLPDWCEDAVQAAMSSSKSGWEHARLRGVTLGRAGGWVVFYDNHHHVKYSESLPKKLKKALFDGMMEKKIINVSEPKSTRNTKTPMGHSTIMARAPRLHGFPPSLASCSQFARRARVPCGLSGRNCVLLLPRKLPRSLCEQCRAVGHCQGGGISAPP
jgi:hypothetical protein